MDISAHRLAQLRVTSDDAAALEAKVAALVGLLRLQGVSWTAIGVALRVSRQGAQQRYTR